MEQLPGIKIIKYTGSLNFATFDKFMQSVMKIVEIENIVASNAPRVSRIAAYFMYKLIKLIKMIQMIKMNATLLCTILFSLFENSGSNLSKDCTICLVWENYVCMNDTS